jgi:hypothetical protein
MSSSAPSELGGLGEVGGLLHPNLNGRYSTEELCTMLQVRVCECVYCIVYSGVLFNVFSSVCFPVCACVFSYAATPFNYSPFCQGSRMKTNIAMIYIILYAGF